MTTTRLPLVSGSPLLCLLVILVAGLCLRLHGIAFGLPALLDPDELIFELGAYKMVESGTGNPAWFGHPATTTMYVLVVVNALVYAAGLVTGSFSSPDDFADAIFTNPGLLILPGRIAMALVAVVGIWLIYRLGRRAAGESAGLIAAAVLACSPLHVTWSQVVRSDILATTFLTATMLIAYRYRQTGLTRDLALASLCAALAITSKWPFAVSLIAIFGAIGVRAIEDGVGRMLSIKRAVLAALLTIVFAVLISPYLVLDNATLVSNLSGEMQTKHVGRNGGGVVLNLYYYFSHLFFYGVAPVAFVLGVVGFVLLRRNLSFNMIMVLPSLAMLAVIASQTLVWERWSIGLIPVLAVAGGAALSQALALLSGSTKGSAWAGTGVMLAMLVPMLVTVHYYARERVNDNRSQATEWARANLPAGSTVMIEHFAFDLADADFRLLFPIGTAGCLDAREVLQGRIAYGEVDALRGGNSNLDYAAVPVEQQQTCLTDFAILTEHSRYRAERNLFRSQSEKYESLIRSGRVLARFPASPGEVGGRPEVIVLDTRQAGI